MYTLNVAESKEESDDQTVYVEASGVGQIEEKVNEVLQGLALESESEIKMADVEEVGMEQSKDEGKQCQTVGDVKITDEVTDDLYETLNQVIIELEKSNLKDEFKSFLKLVASKSFPLDNVAFLLFMDVVKFFSTEDIRLMRYSDTSCTLKCA